MVKYFFRR